MSFFDDKDYEQLDWLSKACEPYRWSVVDECFELPDKLYISARQLISAEYSTFYPTRCSERSCVRYCRTDPHHPSSCIPDRAVPIVAAMYDWSVLDGLVIEDFNTTIEVPKLKSFDISEQLIFNTFMDYYFREYDYVNHAQWRYCKKLAEDLNVEFTYIDFGTLNNKKKAMYLFMRVRDKLMANKWNIRNLDLLAQALEWAYDYACYGRLSSLINLTKLQCLSHFDKPIYSMEVIQ